MGTPHWLANLGLENPSIDEFLHRPDLRQIASFFLGILFATSVYCFIRCPTFISISRRIFKRTPQAPSHTESALGTINKPPSSLESTNHHLDPLALIFILNLVYITTSATRFASLLAFSSRAGTVACTFLIAWGTLGAQTVRLIAILRMSLHLRELGSARWESYALWAALVLTSIVMFLDAAVSTGVLRSIPQIQSFSLCYMRHFLLGAAVVAGMNIIMELYILLRVVTLILPWFLAFKSKMKALKDIRVFRVLSLLVLDGATVYPSLFPTSLLADFVPFSVASLLLLIAFNYSPRSQKAFMASFIDPHPPSLPLSIRIPTPEFSPHLHIPASMPSPSSKDMSRLDISAPENVSLRSVHSRISVPRRKPTPIELLRDTPPFTKDLHGYSRPQSSQTWATGSLSDSVRGAVVGIAKRTRVVPLLSERARKRSDSTGTQEESLDLARTGIKAKSKSRTSSPPVPIIGSHFRWAAERSSAPSQLSEVSEPLESPRIQEPPQVAAAELIGRKISTQAHTVPSRRLVKASRLSSQDSSSGPASPPFPPRSLQTLQSAPSPNRERESFLHITASSGEEFTFLGGDTASPPQEEANAAAISAGSDSTFTQRGGILRRDSSTRRGSQLNRGSDSLADQYPRASYSAFSSNLPESSRHSAAVSSMESQQFRTGEGLRPRPTEDLNLRTNELSIVHETSTSHTTTPKKEAKNEGRNGDDSESPTRPTLSSLKRPTFGSASFEAFRSSFPVPSEGGALSPTTRDSGSGYGSPTSPSEYGSRADPSRLPRSSFGARSRVRSSGTERSLERGGKDDRKVSNEKEGKGKTPAHLSPHDQPPSST